MRFRTTTIAEVIGLATVFVLSAILSGSIFYVYAPEYITESNTITVVFGTVIISIVFTLLILSPIQSVTELYENIEFEVLTYLFMFLYLGEMSIFINHNHICELVNYYCTPISVDGLFIALNITITSAMFLLIQPIYKQGKSLVEAGTIPKNAPIIFGIFLLIASIVNIIFHFINGNYITMASFVCLILTISMIQENKEENNYVVGYASQMFSFGFRKLSYLIRIIFYSKYSTLKAAIAGFFIGLGTILYGPLMIQGVLMNMTILSLIFVIARKTKKELLNEIINKNEQVLLERIYRNLK